MLTINRNDRQPAVKDLVSCFAAVTIHLDQRYEGRRLNQVSLFAHPFRSNGGTLEHVI
jgi:hypothetical protein